MKILALDTALSACSVAVCIDGETVSCALEPMTRGQSEALMPMVLSVLEEARMRVEEFDLIAVTRGPGAFTGLRIGLAAARGLALASGVPCCGVTSTQAIALAARMSVRADQSLIVALDSKRSDLYIQAFAPDGSAVSEPQAIGVDDLANHVGRLALAGPVAVVGDAADRALALLPEGYLKSPAAGLPDARYVAGVAEQMAQSGTPMVKPQPLYLRPPDATVPKNGGRLRP